MNAIMKARLSKRLTIEELAELAGVSPATISYLENGKKKARGLTLQKLAEALDIPIESLLGNPNTKAA
jgi:transcriptional regulator with XRE-family HTH domain